jgi:hypothetical protein
LEKLQRVSWKSTKLNASLKSSRAFWQEKAVLSYRRDLDAAWVKSAIGQSRYSATVAKLM